MNRAWLRTLRLVMALGVGGVGLQFSGCGPQDVGAYLANLNPCGTILVCDPVTYDFVRSGYKGPGADPDIDPACTYPPFCANDPFVATQGTE